MPHRTDVAAAAAQADEAAASFAGQGMEKEWAISRCMASHYQEALPRTSQIREGRS